MAASKFFAVGKLFVVLVVAGVLGAAVLLPYFGGVGLVAKDQADRFLNTKCNLNDTIATDQTSYLYASDGKTLIAKFFTQNRVPVALASVNKPTQRALIDTEDRRFYEHHGVDPRGLARALLNESGGSTQGASTLTQQYVKQVRFYQAKTDAEKQAAIEQTPARKIVEARCALDLEKKYSKDQILEKYLNIAYFGQQSYGIEVAAQNYFGLHASQLDIPRAAVLVGLVKDPTLYNPFINLKASTQRRNEVIQNMVTAGDISQAQADAYKKQPIKTTSSKNDEAQQGCAFPTASIKNVGFFCDYLVNWLATKGGISTDTLQKGGLRIVSSINVEQQNYTQQQTWNNFDPSSSSAVMMPQIDPTNGRILALATSKYYDYGQQHPKDPRYTTVSLFSTPASGSGSTFKYFSTVAALTAGMQDSTGLNAGAPYTPKNCPNADPNNPVRNAGSYRSYLSLRDALVQSSNTFFVGLEDQFFGCDLSTIVQTAQNLGVSFAPGQAQKIANEHQYNFTLGQTSVSPLDLTVAYGVSAADGVLHPPNPILRITDPSGRPVNYKKPAASRQMSQWVARTIINMMIGDTQSGTAASPFYSYYNALGQDGHLVASKTGTNNASTNGVDNGQNAGLWFVGLTPHLAAATAIYDPKSPTSTINLPDLGSGTGDTFGAYGAGKVWIPALQPFLARTSWQWAPADQINGAQQVPVSQIVGRSESDAQAAIQQAGFKPVRYPVECGSRNPVPGLVAWAGPGWAKPGEAVYYCMNNSTGLSSPPAPPKQSTPSTGPTANPPGQSPPGGGNGGGRNTNPPRRGR